MKLTEKQNWMLNYVKNNSNYANGRTNEYITPTEVGNAYGKYRGGRWHHSAIASPTLLRLTEMGLLKRNDKGHYKYKI